MAANNRRLDSALLIMQGYFGRYERSGHQIDISNKTCNFAIFHVLTELHDIYNSPIFMLEDIICRNLAQYGDEITFLKNYENR